MTLLKNETKRVNDKEFGNTTRNEYGSKNQTRILFCVLRIVRPTPGSMIRSAFYILVLLVVSVIRSTQNHYLDSIPGHDNKELHNVVNASNSNKVIKDVVNHEGPIPVDDLLDQLSDEVKLGDDQRKSELVRISQQLGTALFDNSIGKVKVLMKSISHVVDVGLAGSSQRKRSAKKADGVMKGFVNGLSRLGKWFCGLFVSENIPENFDVRKAWPDCQDLTSAIRDQGHIKSSSAVATVSTLSDRLCIASEGIHKKFLSSEDLIRCCARCSYLEEGVVVGGNIDIMLNFMKYMGIVSGGEYNSEKGCMPYSYPPYKQKQQQKKIACDGKCSNSKYKTPYDEDKNFIDGHEYYRLPEQKAAIKAELMAKGSCIATMIEYEDFRTGYKEGIYTREGSNYLNAVDHTIRLIGWGKENGIEYWLVANSRGANWGEGGTAKINIDSGCSFGHQVWCVKPRVPPLHAEVRPN